MLTDDWGTQLLLGPPDVLKIECQIRTQASDNTRYLDPGAIRAAFEC